VGAGQIGEYSECSYYVQGIGTFRGSELSNPTIGEPGQLENVTELRLEVRCPKSLVPRAVRELVKAHPYEEPAYFIYPLDIQSGDPGPGRYGSLSAPTTLQGFLDLVKGRLGISRLQFTGDPAQSIAKVAVACGSGGEFLKDALRLGCDVLLTGEARFHSLLEAKASNKALVLAGHYATERPAMEHLAERILEHFPELTAFASREEADPLQWA
jgi:hypothetical protein